MAIRSSVCGSHSKIGGRACGQGTQGPVGQGDGDRRLWDIQGGTNEGGGEVEVDAVPESLVPLQGEEQRSSSGVAVESHSELTAFGGELHGLAIRLDEHPGAGSSIGLQAVGMTPNPAHELGEKFWGGVVGLQVLEEGEGHQEVAEGEATACPALAHTPGQLGRVSSVAPETGTAMRCRPIPDGVVDDGGSERGLHFREAADAGDVLDDVGEA